jgi:hypothetical protein
LLLLALLVVAAVSGLSLLQEKPTAVSMKAAAVDFLGTLDETQTSVAVMPYESAERLDWHFIPKDKRKGLQVKNMTEAQQESAFHLLRAALSQSGYDKARSVMSLEQVLAAFQKGDSPIRDPQRYYFTIFGDPSGERVWGLSFEGHHLSMNFVVDKDQVVSTTPIFYAANPTIVKTDKVPAVKDGTRVLAAEETLAFDLVQSLDEAQAKTAIINETAPREIRGAGEPNPPKDAPAGIKASELNKAQQELAIKLIKTYFNNLPAEINAQQWKLFEEAGLDDVRFAWAGATQPGIGHYYLLEGPTFQIEFVNTQPDSMGNPASHIHCVLRNPRGDFAIPVR